MRYIIIILIVLFPFIGFSQDKIPVKQLDIGAVKSPNAKASLYIADKRNDNLMPGTDIQSGLFFSLKTPATVGIPKTGGHSFGSTLTIVPWLDDTGNDYAAYRLTGYNGNLYYQFYNNGSWLSQNIIATQNYVDSKVESVPHNGSYVLQKSIEAALFSSNAGSIGKEVLDNGTVGSDWSYTIPAGTFTSNSTNSVIEISFATDNSGGAGNMSSDLYVRISDGTNTEDIPVINNLAQDFPTAINTLVITNRSSGVVYYANTQRTLRGSAIIDLTKDLTISFVYERHNNSSDDITVLPVIIKTADIAP